MKIIRITDDISPTPAKVVKMRCDCEWEEKAYIYDSLGRSQLHFVNNHGGNGVILYKGDAREVKAGELLPAWAPSHR